MTTYTIEQLETLLSRISQGKWYINPTHKFMYEVRTPKREVAKALHAAALGSGDNEVKTNAELIAAAPAIARQLLATMRENEVLKAELAVANARVKKALAIEPIDFAGHYTYEEGYNAALDAVRKALTST